MKGLTETIMFGSNKSWRGAALSAVALALLSSACESGSKCKQWQVNTVKIKSSQKEQAVPIEQGWEPFGNVGLKRVWLRRCAP